MKLYSILVFFLLIFFVQSCDSKNNGTIDKNISEATDIAKNEIYFESTKKNSTEELDVLNENITTTRSNAITRTVEKTNPAIVGINVTEYVRYVESDPWDMFPFFRNRQKRIREYEVKGLGSGFIISPDGYILTNHHVAGNASKCIITMTNGMEFDAKIIGSDRVSDVALLKIEADDLPYLKFGDSDDVLVGEWAIAFGNPFGLFEQNAKPTVTVGIVSNKGINFSHEDNEGIRVYKDMIQTDAAISSGNSGGPLLNAMGEVIGMNTVIFSTANTRQGSGSIGIGFAIPINRVKKIINLLKQSGEINRDYHIGIEVKELDEKLVRYLKTNVKHGVVIFGIERNSPVDKAGFEPGDIILKISDIRINRVEDYQVAVYDGIVGQTLKFVILRGDDVIKKELKLTQRRYK